MEVGIAANRINIGIAGIITCPHFMQKRIPMITNIKSDNTFADDFEATSFSLFLLETFGSFVSTRGLLFGIIGMRLSGRWTSLCVSSSGKSGTDSKLSGEELSPKS